MFFAKFVQCWLVAFLFFALFSACIPHPDIHDPLGRDAILFSVNKKLTDKKCGEALAEILQLYNSEFTDNEVRMTTASAYACAANIELIKLIGDLSERSSQLSTSGFWRVMTELFPANVSVDAANLGIDALHSVLFPGTVVSTANKINAGSYNEGSANVGDRLTDANIFLTFLSMPVMGSIQNQYGSPNGSYAKTVDLPWTTATAAGMSSDGCAYASAVLNFIDGLGVSAVAIPAGELNETLQSMLNVFASQINNACAIGCSNANPAGPWGPSGCTAATPCTACPTTLRNRENCQALNTDVNSCAAAGIVNFINYDPLGWN